MNIIDNGLFILKTIHDQMSIIKTLICFKIYNNHLFT